MMIADALPDRIVMLQMQRSNTMAHDFIEKMRPMRYAEPAMIHLYLGSGDRLYIPHDRDDRVIMFADRSGVYVSHSGTIIPLGADISDDVTDWDLVH